MHVFLGSVNDGALHWTVHTRLASFLRSKSFDSIIIKIDFSRKLAFCAQSWQISKNQYVGLNFGSRCDIPAGWTVPRSRWPWTLFLHATTTDLSESSRRRTPSDRDARTHILPDPSTVTWMYYLRPGRSGGYSSMDMVLTLRVNYGRTTAS